MAFLPNIRSLFSRKKPVDAATDVSSAEPIADVAAAGSSEQSISTDAAPPPSNVVNIYSHGFTNGVFRVEPDEAGFERFLEFCNQSDRIKEQQVLNKLAIARVLERLTVQRAADADDGGIIVEKEKAGENLSRSIDELMGVRVNMERKEAGLQAKQSETVAEYAWVPALLFLIAGITFIAADISITKQITSWGFNMSGRSGWIYAIGLAFTAFLIKPTIDRLLERPFQSSGFQLKRLYKVFLLGVTLTGLVMLWCLGKFRADSERARGKLDALTNQMNLLVPTSAEFKAKQADYDDVQRSLDENSMGQNGLVMSGLLFAIGGAICLSVSFGSLKQLINRYWILPARIRGAKGKIKAVRRRLDGLRMEHTLITTEQEKAAKRILASESAVLQADLDRLNAEESTLLTAFYEAQFERERALYRDGRSRGEKYKLEGELLYKTFGNDSAPLYTGKGNVSNGEQSNGSPRSYTRRPFIKMRKMIADNFNKNQNNQAHDGSEFEIIS